MRGQLLASISNSYFADYFNHFGFVRNNRTDNLLSEIDRKFRLKCWVQFSTGHKSGLVSIIATSPLIATGYSVKESP